MVVSTKLLNVRLVAVGFELRKIGFRSIRACNAGQFGLCCLRYSFWMGFKGQPKRTLLVKGSNFLRQPLLVQRAPRFVGVPRA